MANSESVVKRVIEQTNKRVQYDWDAIKNQIRKAFEAKKKMTFKQGKHFHCKPESFVRSMYRGVVWVNHLKIEIRGNNVVVSDRNAP